ncbi:AfsR/SARP family transcriptional regulator [Nonomuraea zeae]|uniref:AfsR/SARP family transcriptional regulator n=1 Tax=Nonomuraea zeae TaxID=1642303 RepID=UPI0014792809|nr:BTAD domain-containing putative transcriptional regulator [Nonomuraea zeae]
MDDLMAGVVRCSILGPLQVEAEGRPVDPGPVRARAVLVALSLADGHGVTADRLIAELWGDAPPPSARGQIQVLVSQLRKVLGNAAIETVAGGYRLDPRAVHLDADEAERLIAQGRQGHESAPYRRALALWRGPVLDGLDHPQAHRLEELRLTAAEEWAELERDRGGLEQVVAVLTPMLAAQPHHERLRARLATALDRLGRRAEALRLLREGRALLDDLFGLEPGAELRQAERRIGGEASPPVPAQLPQAIATFTGRQAEVERLAGLLAAAPRRSAAVFGPAGVGKSALAIQVAHRVARHFPDGQLYVNLRGATPHAEPAPAVQVLGRFLRALGVPASEIPQEVDEATAAFRSLTRGRRVLVVLDNAADAAQVRALLPGSASCGVLVTSRRRLGSLDTASNRALAALPQDEAYALVARLVGDDRMAREPEPAADVVRLCGRLPLALAIVAARLSTRPDRPIRFMAERLAVEQRRLTELSVDDQAVRASFMVSYQDLGEPAAARLFRLLGLLDVPDVSVPVAAALAGLPEARAATLLDQLADNQLAECPAPGRFRVHDLLRLFARELAESEDGERDRAAAVRRALHHYLATARHAAMAVEPLLAWRLDFVPDDLAYPGTPLRSPAAVQSWLDAEIENVIAAARQALEGDDPAIAAYLAACLNTPLEYRARWREHLTLGHLMLRAADRIGDARMAGIGHNDLGWALHALGRATDALGSFDRALAAWERFASAGSGAETGLALALNGRGAALRSLGRHEESLLALEAARMLWQRLGHARHEAACLTGIGLTLQRLGRHGPAIVAHEKAMVLAGESDAKVTEVMALGNLGEAHRLAGQAEEAAVRFREALELDLRRGLEGTYWEAEHSWGLGLATGDRTHLNRAAAVLHDLGLLTYEELRAIERDEHPATPDVIAQQL